MAGFSVKKPFTVLVVVVIIFALGITSFRSMKPELLPNLELPYIIAMTTYPGATSEQVEADVTKPLEQGFATLEGLKSITSQSNANYSMINMEFADGTNLDGTTIDIMQRIERVRGGWDSIVGSPIIIKMNPNLLPVMIAAVERDGMGTADLSQMMDTELQPKLEGIDGVASLDISGIRKEQVNVAIRADKVAGVNARIATAVQNDINSKEQDLRKTKSDLEAQLNDLKQKSGELDDGVNKFAEGIESGASKLGEGWADWGLGLTGLNDMKTNLEGMKELLATLKQAITDALAAAEQDKGEPLTQEEIDAITSGVEGGFGTSLDQLHAGIDQLKAGINAMETAGKQLAEAQGALDKMSVETQYQLNSAAAALVAGQGQISAGISQIQTGLDQFDDALDTALKQADMSAVLTTGTISSILQAQNFAMPAGYVKQDNTDYLVRVGDQVGTIDELKDMALMDTGIDDVGVIRLSDVADVFMSDNLSDVYAKVNGNDGILLEFMKQSEYSTTQVTDAITAKFTELEKQYPGLKFTPMMNQGDYIYRVINSITSDLMWGALFAVLILLLFLRDLRPTFITLCSIPISLVFALVAMYFAGVTINIISLSGLAIAVGRLVDDSVVVIENIFRLRNKGYSPVKAAVSGTMQVAGAITASTLTTISVFLPLVFVTGITRQIFKDFGLTFAFALLASLAIAMTLVPTLASGMFKTMQPKEHRWLDRVIFVYDKALVWALRYKPVILILAIVLLAGSAYAMINKGFSYMPAGTSNQISITLTMPKDSTPDQRKVRADEAQTRISGIEGVDTVGMMSGASQSGTLSLLSGGAGSGDDMRNVTSYVLLDDKADVTKVSGEIENALADMDMETNVSSSGGMDITMLGGSGITVNIYGDQTADLIESSSRISNALSGIEGVDKIDNGLEDATPEINFTVDRMKAAEHGLTTAQVFQQVSAALSKESTATNVTWKNDSYDIVMVNENDESGDLTPDYIKGLEFPVTKRDGTTEQVKLSDIATVSESQTLPSISRSEQRRYMAVNITIGDNYNITLMAQEVDKALAGVQLPDGVSYEVTGENATIMDAFQQLGFMLLLGLLLVYLIMVAQFQSLKSPFIIMFTVPLAFTGGFLALLLTGQILSVISLIGFAMLVGVIVANAIVLVDYINRLRMDGMERVAAIREGAATRMRPILMTALATIFALLMMALGVGNGSQMMQPLAIVCIGGLAYGTLMTLFVIPIIYDAFSKKELRKVAAEDLVVDRDA